MTGAFDISLIWRESPMICDAFNLYGLCGSSFDGKKHWGLEKLHCHPVMKIFDIKKESQALFLL
jgi:hypothetical protein